MTKDDANARLIDAAVEGIDFLVTFVRGDIAYLNEDELESRIATANTLIAFAGLGTAEAVVVNDNALVVEFTPE